MRGFVGFRKMMTPRLIQFIFWFGVVVCELLGLLFILGGISTMNDYNSVDGSGGGLLALVLYVLFALFLMVLGPIFVRIFCELVMVVFRINETLAEIRDLLDQG
jgi:hypothetical protein